MPGAQEPIQPVDLFELLPNELVSRILGFLQGKSNVEYARDLTRTSRVNRHMYELVGVLMRDFWYAKCKQMRWNYESWTRLFAESNGASSVPSSLPFLSDEAAAAVVWFRIHSSHMTTRKHVRQLFAKIESRSASDARVDNTSTNVFSPWPPPPDVDQIIATQEDLGVEFPVELIEFHQCRLRFLDKFIVDEFSLLNIRRRQLSGISRKILRTELPEIVLLQISEESMNNRALYVASRVLEKRRVTFADDMSAVGSVEPFLLKEGAIFMTDGWNVFFMATSFISFLQSRLR